MRKLASESISFARDTRPRSPPESSLIRLNTSSPVNKNAASTLRIRVCYQGWGRCRIFLQIWFYPDPEAAVPGHSSRYGPWLPDGSVRRQQDKAVNNLQDRVFPVPLFPIRATFSPRLMSMEYGKINCGCQRTLPGPSAIRTSFPLITEGVRVRCMEALTSTGLSSRSTLARSFSRLSAV